MNIPIDIDALDAIFDMAREGKSAGTRAFIDRHAGTLRTLLEAFHRQAQRIAQQQAQGQGDQQQPPASTPPTAPKEPFDPHTPAAQANRDKRKAQRLAKQAGKAAAQQPQEYDSEYEGLDSDPPDQSPV